MQMKKEEFIKTEWKDSNEQKKYVCDGAMVQCNFCASPSQLKVIGTGVYLQDKLMATTADKDGKVNLNFAGPCMHPSQQKLLSPPPPCKSIISLGEWNRTSDVMVGSDKLLLVESQIICSISGSPLKIRHSAQQATLPSLTKVVMPVPVKGVDEKSIENKNE